MASTDMFSGPGVRPSGGFEGWANNNLSGGFDAWKQRQFSMDPFKAGDPLNVQPWQVKPGASGLGAQSQPWQNPASWDPRQIQNSPAYKQLMQLAQNGSGGAARARTDSAPAMEYYKQALASGDPLGTQMLPELTFQQNMATTRQAGQVANRRIEESAGGANASANPAMLEFMKILASAGQAGAIGEAGRGATSARIQERSATKSFQQAVAQAMAALAGSLGGLDISEGSLKAGAAGSAGQLDSFANNQWAQLMAQLLMQDRQPRGYQPSTPLRGYDSRGNPLLDRNPFPGFDQIGR